MYEAFFGLRSRPFSPLPRVDSYVALTPMRESLDALIRCVEQDRGIGVLTSPAGTGKSLICRLLQLHFAEQRRSVLLTTGRFPTRRALLQAILFGMKHPYVGLSEQEARLRMLDLLQSSPAPQNRLLLIVDEAHLLSPKGHEELRTLTDYESQGLPLVSLVLAGQLELEETLAEPMMSALNQRVGCHVSIEALTLEESAIYIRERLRMAGNDGLTVFTPEAIHLICTASEGNPRRLSQLCDHSLLLAYAEGTRPVDVPEVRSALLDLRELPLHWNSPLDLDDTRDASPLSEYAGTHAAENGELHSQEEDTALDPEDPHDEQSAHEVPVSAVYEVGGDDVSDRDSPSIDQFFHTSEFVFPTELQSDVTSFIEILKSPAESSTALSETAPMQTASEPIDASAERCPQPIECTHAYGKSGAVTEESVVDDPYAAIDRLQESQLPAVPPKTTELFPVQVEPVSLYPSGEAVAADDTVTQECRASRESLIEEEQILELIHMIGEEVQDARELLRHSSEDSVRPTESTVRPNSGYQSLREALSWQFDVVEPESAAKPVLTAPPAMPAGAAESMGSVDVSATEIQVEGPHDRRYAQLFTRLQKQRRRVEAVMNRERRTSQESRSH